MEKASSHKFLTLLLNPLEESIKLCGIDSANLPENCLERVNKVLHGMKTIFKTSDSTKSSNPPTSLVESYIELTLLADENYQKTGKLVFEKYFTLFMQVKSLVQRQAG